jgi:aspartate dehydrogenase
MKSRKKIRVVFIGWGAINSRVGALLTERGSNIEIAAVATADTPQARAAIPDGIPFLSGPAALAAIKPDLLVEAAGRAAIEQWIPEAVRHTPAAILASTSALCDDALLFQLQEVAEKNDTRILIPSGAIGGIDALASAAVLGLDTVTHQIAKPGQAWRGTAAEQLVDLSSLTARNVFFRGSARDAAMQYPQNANATVVTSLAGIGLDRTTVELIADPSLATNSHRILAEGAFGKMDITLHNSPLATNPKSSELTALSLVHLIERQSCTLVI